MVPSDYASLNDLGPEPDDATAIGIPEPALTPESLEAFVRHRDENPTARYFARTRDGRRELRALALYQQVYAPLRIQHQIAFTPPGSGGDCNSSATGAAEPDPDASYVAEGIASCSEAARTKAIVRPRRQTREIARVSSGGRIR